MYLETEGKTKITTAKNTEEWKAARGFWDGGKNDDARSVCGIVVMAVDREKLITISKNAVPLKACTAMAAEITRSQRID